MGSFLPIFLVVKRHPAQGSEILQAAGMAGEEDSLLKPTVKVFFSTKSNGPIGMEVVDQQRSQDAIEGMEGPVAWSFDLGKLTGV